MSNPPPFLYRYYGNFEYVLDTLINKRIYFSSPNQFNDPFDCHPNFYLLYCRREEESIWKRYMYILAKFEYPDISDEEAHKHAEAAIAIKQLHKDRKWLLDADKDDKSRMEELLKNVRICCFTKSRTSQTMWAHYADKHKGIALKFRSSRMYDDRSGEFRGCDVKYYDKPISLEDCVKAMEDTQEDPTAFARLMYCSKTAEWCPEKEVRFFSTNKRYMDCSEEMLSGIFIGARCPVERRDRLLTILSSWKSKSEVYIENPKRSNIQIHFERVKYE